MRSPPLIAPRIELEPSITDLQLVVLSFFMKGSPAQPVTMDSAAGFQQTPRDCVHFLRTGTCRYGPNCRFNHPGVADTMQAVSYVPQVPEFPERIGQPDCQFYLKTGTCKFGTQCKYHHPQVKAGSARGPPLLNFVGLPMRPGEKECSYYLRTGSCKFGVACKFHHPEPSAPGARSPAYLNGATLHPASVPSWPVPRPLYFTGSGLPGSSPYMPVYASPQSIPFNGAWNSYQSMGTSQSNGDYRGFFNGGQQQQVVVRPGFDGSSNRLEQPDCQYYVQTGHCKFGASCRYQHPKSMAISLVPATLSPMGLPLRPGQPLCTFYLRNGICKFGPVCRYDHPIKDPSILSPPSLPLKETAKVDEGAPLREKNSGSGSGESSEALQDGHDSATESAGE